jgi:uncharacterized membrane protein YbhN (UPF0104 family)
VAAAITTGLAALLIREANWKEFVAIAQQASRPPLLAALGLYLIFNLLRALRYRVLLGRRHDLALWPLFSIGLYHNFLTRTLPFAAGEFSYVLLLRRYLGIDASQGISSLLGARLLEALFVAIGGLAGILVLQGQASSTVWLLGAVALAILVVAVAAILLSGRVLRTMTAWLGPSTDGCGRLASLRPRLERLAAVLDELRNRRRLLPAAALSALTYLSSFGFHVLMLLAAGFDESAAVLLVVVTLSNVALWFPFTLAGFGAVESGWVLGLTVFAGMGLTPAVNLAFFLHGGLVVAILFTGLLGLALMAVLLPRRPGKPEP